MFRFIVVPAALAFGVLAGALVPELSSGVGSAAGSLMTRFRAAPSAEPGSDDAPASHSHGSETEKGHGQEGAGSDEHAHGDD
jgi:membrane fusion protein, heavy metal efflux system